MKRREERRRATESEPKGTEEATRVWKSGKLFQLLLLGRMEGRRQIAMGLRSVHVNTNQSQVDSYRVAFQIWQGI